MGEVADVDLGKMLDGKKQTGEHAVPYLRNVNVRWGRLDLSDLKSMDVAPAERLRYTVRTGDLLLCEGGEPGRSALVPPAGDGLAYQKALHRIRPHHGVHARYLAYAVRAMAELGHLAGHMTGSTIQHLPLERLKSIPVPLPPHPEQLRIAAVLGEQMTYLEKAQETVSTVRRKLHLLEASLRARALQGDRGAGADRAPSRTEVLEARGRYGQRRFTEATPADAPTQVPSHWSTVSLADISWDIGYGTSLKCDYAGEGVGVLRIPNIVSGTVDVQDLKRAVDTRVDLTGTLVEPGDVLVVRTNGSKDLIGRSAAVKDSPGLSFASYLIRLRVVTAVVDPRWVVLVLSSPHWRSMLEGRAASSAGQLNLSIGKLGDIPLPLPPLDEQRQLCDQFADDMVTIKHAAGQLDAVERRTLVLRRSMLAAAVAGRLVTQESSDEPSAMVLERIRAARRASKPTDKHPRPGTVRRARKSTEQEKAR